MMSGFRSRDNVPDLPDHCPVEASPLVNDIHGQTGAAAQLEKRALRILPATISGDGKIHGRKPLVLFRARAVRTRSGSWRALSRSLLP